MRGKASKFFAGSDNHQAVGILKFPDIGSAESWYGSDAYQALIPNRDEAADMVITSYEAIEA